MSRSCPSCGTATEFESQTARVLRGSCTSCGGAFTIVQDVLPTGEADTTATLDVVGASGAEGLTAPGSGGGLSCNSCGATMTLRATSPSTLEATCAGCGEIVRFVDASSIPRERPMRAPRRDREDRGDREERGGGFGSPPSRPCRECGGALKFTTADDGTVTGECTSCGNRFVLPPRRDRGGRDGGRGRSGGYGGRGYRDSRSGPPRGGGFRRTGGYGARGGSEEGRTSRGPPRTGGGYRRREERGDDDGDDNRRDRRRRRFSRD